MRVGLALGLMVWATSAVADCPTRDDLKTGIRFTIQGGETETFSTKGRNSVFAYYDYGDGTGTGNLMLHGHYLLSITEYKNGKALAGSPLVRYKLRSTPPVPAPNTKWSGISIATENGERYEVTETHELGGLKVTKLGKCSYKSIPIKSTIVEGEFVDVETVSYIVDLGIALMTRHKNNYGTNETYKYRTIEAVK